jgi:ectoine hydroxylase-related dioxygenase (phytanoyl-CoA dioxygenase family)
MDEKGGRDRKEATTHQKKRDTTMAYDDVKAEFDEYGFVVLREVVARKDALRIAERVREIMNEQPDAGKPDQHLRGTFNYLKPADDALFLPLVTQPMCLELAWHLLGDGFQMTEVGCRRRGPGAPAGPVHVTIPLDAISRAGLPMPNICFVLAFSWMLNDLTQDMGATVYLPFSQHAPRAPRPGVAYKHALTVEAPAGSVIVHHGGL